MPTITRVSHTDDLKLDHRIIHVELNEAPPIAWRGHFRDVTAMQTIFNDIKLVGDRRIRVEIGQPAFPLDKALEAIDGFIERANSRAGSN